MKVLLATEGSGFSKLAIERCCEMFDESMNTEIRIISVAELAVMPVESFPVSADYIRDVDAAAMKKANDAVHEAKREIRSRFPDMSNGLTTTMLTGSPHQAIVEEAKNWGADLIIMGSHGYGFFQRALLGSVSDWVVHHAPCAVLVVRSSETLNGKSTSNRLGKMAHV